MRVAEFCSLKHYFLSQIEVNEIYFGFGMSFLQKQLSKKRMNFLNLIKAVIFKEKVLYFSKSMAMGRKQKNLFLFLFQPLPFFGYFSEKKSHPSLKKK